jgi:ariadne-1
LKENNNGVCSIMYMDFDENDEYFVPLELSCGHQFSKAAWQNYLKTRVQSDGPACVYANCMQPRCNVVIPHSFYLKNLPDEEIEIITEAEEEVKNESGVIIFPKVDYKKEKVNLLNKYMLWHSKNFTDNSKTIKMCPQKGCEYIIEKPNFCNQNIIKCKCDKEFCFKCYYPEDHLPTICEQVQNWLEKETANSGNIDWIKSHTKPCPKCKIPIEKN